MNNVIALASAALFALPSMASDFYWSSDIQEGRLSLLQTWCDASGNPVGTLPTLSDTLHLEGGSARLVTTAEEYGESRSVVFPGFEVVNNAQLEIAFPSGVSYVQAGFLNIRGGSNVRMTGGTFFTNGRSMALTGGNSRMTFTGPNAVLTTLVQGNHMNNNAQMWDANPEYAFENGACASNAYFITWGAGSKVVFTGAGSCLKGANSTVDFATNPRESCCVEVVDGAFVDGSSTINLDGNSNSFLLKDAALSNGVVRITGAASSGLLTNSLVNASICVDGENTDVRILHSVSTTDKALRVGDRGRSNSKLTISDKSNLSAGESTVGTQNSSGALLHVTGAGTVLSLKFSNQHENSSTLHIGYSSSGGNNGGGAITDAGHDATVLVDDGAVMEVVARDGITVSPDGGQGIVIGKSTGADHCRLVVGSGGQVSSHYRTHIGGMHSSWGGGSFGELLVSNGVFHCDTHMYVNGGTNGDNDFRASTNNTLRVVDGGTATIDGNILFNGTVQSGNGLVAVENGSLSFVSLYARVQGRHGPSTLEVAGTNGTITALQMSDVSAPLTLRFKIADEGRSTEEPFIRTTRDNWYNLPQNESDMENFSLRLDISPKWAKSGKDHYVDLITTAQSSNSSVMSTNKARLENLMAKAVAEDLVDGCTLSVTEDGRTLRLTAGSKPGLTVIVR